MSESQQHFNLKVPTSMTEAAWERQHPTRIMRLTSMSIAAVLSGMCLCASTLFAADFPNRPLKLIVPFTPGTGMDSIARLVGEKLHPRLGQPVVVENRTGLAGHIGAEQAARAPADGHTLLVTARNISITAALYQTPGFNPVTDLSPLMIAAWGTNAVIATPGAKFNSLSELLAQARANPGRITFASAGVGSPSHIALELFQQATDTQFLHVPYKGTGPAVTDLIAGHVQVAFMATHTIMPFVNRGQLKPLAVARSSRHRVAPNVPSFVEEGVKNFVDEGWYGFLMPRGVPTEVQNKLHAEIRSILLLPDVKANLEKIGLDIRPSSIEEMRLWLQKEQADFAAIIRKNGIKGD